MSAIVVSGRVEITVVLLLLHGLLCVCMAWVKHRIGRKIEGPKTKDGNPYLRRITAVVLVLSLMRLLVTTSVREEGCMLAF